MVTKEELLNEMKQISILMMNAQNERTYNILERHLELLEWRYIILYGEDNKDDKT